MSPTSSARGKVVISTMRNSVSTHIATRGPGEIIGEMSLVSGARRSATAKAATDCVLSALPKAEVGGAWRDAFLCAMAIQRAFADYNSASGNEPIISKIGVYLGRTIAVTLNHRLDYYGTAVNFAARLSDLSSGGDIVLSSALAGDPSVESLLQAVRTTRDRASVKGFELPVEFVRYTSPADLPAVALRATVAA